MEYLEQKNKFNFKAAVGLVTVCVLLLFFVPAGSVQAVACPLPYQSGRTIVIFPAKALYANQTEAGAKSGPVTTWIPAGLYNITLVSYDAGHAPGYQPWQTQESYYLILRDSQGNTVTNTPAISDLPDDLTILTEQVATGFSIAQNVASIIAFHAAYPSDGAQSIEPICAAFDNVSPPPLPAVDIKVNNSDGPLTIPYKTSANLTWTSSNADSCYASGDWSGSKAISGSETIQMNTVKTYTFTLTCKDTTGTRTATDSVKVTVTPIPPVVITKPAVITY